MDASHAALQVGQIETTMSFFSLLDFDVISTFSSSGARCAWLATKWSSLVIELIEVPSLLSSCTSGGLRRPTSEDTSETASTQVGLVHLCVDVTPICTDVLSLLEMIQAKPAPTALF